MGIEFSSEARTAMFEKLQAFFLDEFEEELGELRTRRVFEFMVGLVGASAYNQAVSDAQAWLQGKLLDLEGDLHQPGHDASS